MDLMEKWYSYGVIRFTRPQVKWILYNLDELRAGYYPPNPRVTGYDDNGGKKQMRGEGNYVKAAILAAEIDVRLKMIPTPQRYWLIDSYTEGYDFKKIARFYHATRDEVMHEVSRMVSYLAGWKRKQEDYNAWCEYKILVK